MCSSLAKRPPLGTRSPAARPPPPFWPERQRSPLWRQRGGEGGAEREREREREREGALAAPGRRSKRTDEVSTFHRSGETLRLSPFQARAAHGVLMTAALVLSVLGLLQQWYAHGG